MSTTTVKARAAVAQDHGVAHRQWVRLVELASHHVIASHGSTYEPDANTCPAGCGDKHTCALFGRAVTALKTVRSRQPHDELHITVHSPANAHGGYAHASSGLPAIRFDYPVVRLLADCRDNGIELTTLGVNA